MIMNNIHKLTKREVYFGIILSIVIKVAILSFIIQEHKKIDSEKFSSFVYITNDYNYFLKPVDNLFESGKFSYDGETIFAGRLPGYWFPYLIIHSFFNKEVSIVFLITLQILLSILASILFSKLVYFFSKLKTFFYLSIIIYSSNLLLIPFEYMTMTESFSASSFIIGFYFFYRFYLKNSIKILLISGIFLGWMVFLRPFLIGFFLIPIFQILTTKKYFNLIFFLLPILIAEFSWISRNYITKNEFIPLRTSNYVSYGKIYSKSWLSIRKLINAWGEDSAYFEENSLAHWFRRKDHRTENQVIPKSALKNVNYEISDIVKLKSLYQNFIKNNQMKCDSELDLLIKKKSDNMHDNFKKNNFFKYHLNKWYRLKYMFFKSGSSYLSIMKNNKLTYSIIKGFGLIYYLCFLILGVMYLFKGVLKKENKFYIFLLSAILIFILIFVYYAPVLESRYFIVPFISLIFCSLVNFKNIDVHLIKKNFNNL